MPAARRLALSLLLACGVSLSAQIVSMDDYAVPAGQSYFLDFVRRNQTLLIATTSEVYTAPISPGNRPAFTKFLIASDFVENLSDPSTVASSPLAPDYLLMTSEVLFSNAISRLWIPAPHHVVVFRSPASFTSVGTLAFDSSGGLYVFQGSGAGIQKLDYDHLVATGSNNGDHPIETLFTTGTSGAGALTDRSYGLSVVNDIVYALDLPANRITRYDANDGTYLGAFSVSGAHADSDIAVSETGRLYLTTGNGDGAIYDATTGTLLNTFTSSASNVSVDGGHDGLFLDEENGYFYLFDDETGLHTFQDSALVAIPEPSAVAALAGFAALGLVAFRRRRAA